MSSRPVSAIVLAAGEGTRMRSDRPKPLHVVCGRPMVMHVLHALVGLPMERTVVVVGKGAERVTKKVQEQAPGELHVTFVEQRVQRGTGDAVIVGLTAFEQDDVDDTSTVLVLPGDTPLLRADTLTALVEAHEAEGNGATVLAARLADPTGYGRVLRGKDGRVKRIVEHRDATDEERVVDEVNTSIYCFRRSLLAPALRRVQPDNSQGEYYLTDVVGVLVAAGHGVDAVECPDPAEAQGVNDRRQLSEAEAELRRRTNDGLLAAGVTMVDPSTTYVDTTVELGRDVTLFPGVMLQGETVVGDGTEVGAGCRLVDTVVGSDCVLEKTVADGARIGDRCQVGPFAHIGPGQEVASDTTTGAFYTPGES
jgi:bifunctional UDP-N-acetylglucosamine pyrophosphorylase / glucosamine-1-phosphate N-acetyltransferase